MMTESRYMSTEGQTLFYSFAVVRQDDKLRGTRMQQTSWYADAGFQMIFSVRLLHVDHYFTSYIVEKCPLSLLCELS